MRHRSRFPLTAAFTGLLCTAACTDGPTATLPVFEAGPALDVVANKGRSATAALSGRAEVPPRETHATGVATFRLGDDSPELVYSLIVANIENVVAAHIHLAPAGQNGPIVAFLYGPALPGGGAMNGPLAEGSITAADLVGPLAGHGLQSLLAQMQAGNTYVNVHTSDGVAPANTGPGDWASGEVRGQIR